MSRRSHHLAALAAAAVPGLRPVAVEEVADRVGERFRVAFVEDHEGRRWVVRLPGDAVAAALQDESADLLHLLAPRLPFAVPEPQGAVSLRDGRRAVVYPLIPGDPVSFAALPPGPGPATHLGRAVAAVHDIDRRLYEEADVPDYDATQLRTRRQVDVDRGAATGLVPTGLLNRWERMLDDVSWWRFAPTAVHGRLEESHVLFRFDDPDDASRCAVVGVTSWEGAHVGDPAEDLAEVFTKADPEAFASVLRAYGDARSEPADAHLVDRCRLLGELRLLSDLLAARNLGDRRHVTAATASLRALDDLVSAPGTSGNRAHTVADRLPLDFDSSPAQESWYRAGSPVGGVAVGGDDTARPARADQSDQSDDDRDGPQDPLATQLVDTSEIARRENTARTGTSDVGRDQRGTGVGDAGDAGDPPHDEGPPASATTVGGLASPARGPIGEDGVEEAADRHATDAQGPPAPVAGGRRSGGVDPEDGDPGGGDAGGGDTDAVSPRGASPRDPDPDAPGASDPGSPAATGPAADEADEDPDPRREPDGTKQSRSRENPADRAYRLESPHAPTTREPRPAGPAQGDTPLSAAERGPRTRR
ncbi:phosphotransferase [Agilicoccus flavus]|uniref:phosphotransferase n=1 Tax=Agilicoccus flavus TaxID=2775968 RepID=UPI001CF6F001|nr:phosphotransferase [Agilicoccus flavus]